MFLCLTSGRVNLSHVFNSIFYFFCCRRRIVLISKNKTANQGSRSLKKTLKKTYLYLNVVPAPPSVHPGIAVQSTAPHQVGLTRPHLFYVSTGPVNSDHDAQTRHPVLRATLCAPTVMTRAPQTVIFHKRLAENFSLFMNANKRF